MTATRRLAAIMAVDVVGYSRLMGEDEAGTAPGQWTMPPKNSLGLKKPTLMHISACRKIGASGNRRKRGLEMRAFALKFLFFRAQSVHFGGFFGIAEALFGVRQGCPAGRARGGHAAEPPSSGFAAPSLRYGPFRGDCVSAARQMAVHVF